MTVQHWFRCSGGL